MAEIDSRIKAGQLAEGPILPDGEIRLINLDKSDYVRRLHNAQIREHFAFAGPIISIVIAGAALIATIVQTRSIVTSATPTSGRVAAAQADLNNFIFTSLSRGQSSVPQSQLNEISKSVDSLKSSGHNSDALRELEAELRLQEHQFDNALSLTNGINSTTSHDIRGRAYVAKGQMRNAHSELALANKDKPRPLASIYLAELYSAEDDHANALSVLTQALIEYPRNQVIAERLSLAHCDAGDYDTARRIADNALNIDTDAATLYFALGRATLMIGALTPAENALRESIRLGLGTPDAYLYLSRAQRSRGAVVLAYDSITNGLVANPDSLSLSLERASLLIELVHYDEASVTLNNLQSADQTLLSAKLLDSLIKYRREGSIDSMQHIYDGIDWTSPTDFYLAMLLYNLAHAEWNALISTSTSLEDIRIIASKDPASISRIVAFCRRAIDIAPYWHIPRGFYAEIAAKVQSPDLIADASRLLEEAQSHERLSVELLVCTLTIASTQIDLADADHDPLWESKLRSFVATAQALERQYETLGEEIEPAREYLCALMYDNLAEYLSSRSSDRAPESRVWLAAAERHYRHALEVDGHKSTSDKAHEQLNTETRFKCMANHAYTLQRMGKFSEAISAYKEALNHCLPGMEGPIRQQLKILEQ
ncbi:MAG: hypothetical protein KDA16_00440 [Phycisphaerales bacterium]|nr:hypothetical protein [Phycisphaerales bacterium]